jgi:hypothetical protein
MPYLVGPPRSAGVIDEAAFPAQHVVDHGIDLIRHDVGLRRCQGSEQ